MGQSLYLGDNKWVVIDRMFVDGGTPAKMGLSGGYLVEMAPAIPARPQIYQRGPGFYYTNCVPVEKAEDVEHLPKPYREQALSFIKKSAGKAKPLRVTKGRAADDGTPIPPDRGTPLRDAPLEINSEEQAEQVLIGRGGIRELEGAEARRTS